MEASFWHSRWEANKIGFHQSKVNSRLQSLWANLALPAGSEVFVPLCGKSLDMLWLHQHGFKVLGVELSEIASKAFFIENKLPYEVSHAHGLQVFSGRDEAEGIRIVAGDMFAMPPSMSAEVSAVYDRAAMVAMPPEMRQQYVDQLAALLPVGAQGILISMNYDTSKMNGPPFSIPDNDLQQLLSPYFAVTVVEHFNGPDRLGNLAQRGLDTIEEHVYRIVRQ